MKFDKNKCLVIDKKEGHLKVLVSMVPNINCPLKMPIEKKAAHSSIMEDSTL